jgi:hypothetical protein
VILEVREARRAGGDGRIGLLINLLKCLLHGVKFEVFHESETNIGCITTSILFLVLVLECCVGEFKSGLLR